MAGGANPQMTAMPGGGQVSANPYTQASGAQQAALARTGQGMYQTAAPGMGAYANPYENQVVQASLRDVGGAAQMGLNQLDAQAGAAGAFGGSRHLAHLKPILAVSLALLVKWQVLAVNHLATVRQFRVNRLNRACNSKQ